jgi:hypothetical protein
VFFSSKNIRNLWKYVQKQSNQARAFVNGERLLQRNAQHLGGGARSEDSQVLTMVFILKALFCLRAWGQLRMLPSCAEPLNPPNLGCLWKIIDGDDTLCHPHLGCPREAALVCFVENNPLDILSEFECTRTLRKTTMNG